MSNIYDTNVTFNQPLTNVKDIILVNPTDTLLKLTCTTLDISGQLVATNLSCSGTTTFNTMDITSSATPTSININAPIVPTYSYTLNGTNVPGTIGYIYTAMATFTTNLTLNLDTDITGDLNTKIGNILGGIYMLKLDISYNNTAAALGLTTQLKVNHRFNAYNMLTNVTYFKNLTDTHTYSNTCIINIKTNQTLVHGVRIPQNMPSISNISTTIVNKQYRITLLKIG
jgi:hypothetical protein